MYEVYADDLQAGDRFDIGRRLISVEDIVAFARKWDPRPIHLEDAESSGSRFGEVIASGLHTFAIYNRLSLDTVFGRWAVIAGRRASIEFTHAVTAGMTLTGAVAVASVTPHSERSSTVITTGELLDVASGRTVFAIESEAYMQRRAPHSDQHKR